MLLQIVISNKAYKPNPEQPQTKFVKWMDLGKRAGYEQIMKEQKSLHMVMYYK